MFVYIPQPLWPYIAQEADRPLNTIHPSSIHLVTISQREIAVDIENLSTSLDVDVKLQKVRNFRCRCKKMKAQNSKSPGQTAAGGGDASASMEHDCVSQFSADSVKSRNGYLHIISHSNYAIHHTVVNFYPSHEVIIRNKW